MGIFSFEPNMKVGRTVCHPVYYFDILLSEFSRLQLPSLSSVLLDEHDNDLEYITSEYIEFDKGLVLNYHQGLHYFTCNLCCIHGIS